MKPCLFEEGASRRENYLYDRKEGCTIAISAAQAEVANANVYPLLERLAGESDLLLLRSLLTAVAALAQHGTVRGDLPDAVRERWSERVRTPLCETTLVLP